MKKIIVAVDFSACSLNAASYAAEMALAVKADLFLLHVYQIPVVNLELPVVQKEEDVMKNYGKDMHNLQEQMRGKTSGQLNISSEIRTGDFFTELKDFCETTQPYTVVMGSQGTTALDRLLFGSHAVYAMKHLQWPLITVPAEARFQSVKKIGLACDFDKVVDTIPADEVKTLVSDLNAELHILNTGSKEVFKPGVVFESGLLQEMLGSLNPHYHFIEGTDVEECINNFAFEHHIDLLLIFPRRHNLIDRMIHRSHTKRMVMHSFVPVMALHQ
jgi:nucleotide-binding universal stress UspA family protein